MNNNNNSRNNSNSNNNRRRGRGNNNSRPSGGGGQQINRIDSRARGNAPQMLEKYRKMALDSHMNGDRVNEEYYLQFADHYFRVIADTRVRQEESRQPRDERWQDGRNEAGGERDFNDYGSDDAVDPYDDLRQGSDVRPGSETRQNERQGGERQERYERPERQDRNDRADGQDRDRTERPARRERAERTPRVDQQPVDQPPVAATPAEEQVIETPPVEVDRSVYEPPENPFVRSESRGLKQRRLRRETRDETVREPFAGTGQSNDDAGASDAGANDPRANDPGANDAEVIEPSTLDVFDAAILPPAVGTRRTVEVEPTEAVADAEAETKPRRRARRPRPAADGNDETLKVVS